MDGKNKCYLSWYLGNALSLSSNFKGTPACWIVIVKVACNCKFSNSDKRVKINSANHINYAVLLW